MELGGFYCPKVDAFYFRFIYLIEANWMKCERKKWHNTKKLMMMMMCIHGNVNGFVLVVIPNNVGTHNHRARQKKSFERSKWR